jgi:hypothetical protein
MKTIASLALVAAASGKCACTLFRPIQESVTQQRVMPCGSSLVTSRWSWRGLASGGEPRGACTGLEFATFALASNSLPRGVCRQHACNMHTGTSVGLPFGWAVGHLMCQRWWLRCTPILTNRFGVWHSIRLRLTLSSRINLPLHLHPILLAAKSVSIAALADDADCNACVAHWTEVQAAVPANFV